jgi:hypothetical protein
MQPLDPRTSITVAVREQLAAQQARKPGPAAAAAGATQVQHAAARLAQGIRGIRGDDPQRERKAVRMLLEMRIAAALGSRLVNEAAFGQMLEAIQQQMQQDPATAAAVHAVGNWLCEAGPSG